MCGIFGYIGKPSKKTNIALRTLMDWNELRGRDSTGFVISNGKEFSFYKDTKSANEFLKDPKTIALFKKYNKGNFINVIGHTRQATTGKVTPKNAHPFRIGRFIMAHNGIIHNFNELQKNYKTDYSVDSQIIAYLLNLHEPTEVFEKLLRGWFTVSYFELEKQFELNIAKHFSPLALAILPDGSGMFYSSLKYDLQRALEKAGIRAGVGETKGSKLYSYKWEDGKLLRSKFKIYPKTIQIYTAYGQPYYDPEAFDGENFGYDNGYKYSYNPKKEVEEKTRKQLALVPVKDILKNTVTTYKNKKPIVYTVEKDKSLKRAYC